tara:strand:- start:83 stop:634 length:552 start_codon:yes stop_codon:yes gene_type:complete
MQGSLNFVRILKTLPLVVTLASCITPSIRDWPDDVPPSNLFISAYQADAANQVLQSEQAYLEWILGFYQGTVIYPTGWLDVERQLRNITEPEQRAVLSSRLRNLGILIGSEWAKENEARLIDNRMLALWGTTLQLMQTTDARLGAIELVSQDIEALFAGNLQKTDILEARYAERLGFEVFGDF